jgi:hypothetical protein
MASSRHWICLRRSVIMYVSCLDWVFPPSGPIQHAYSYNRK